MELDDDKAVSNAHSSNKRVNKSYISSIMLEYFLLGVDKKSGKKISLRGYYDMNKEKFEGMFSRSTFVRMWSSSKVKSLHDKVVDPNDYINYQKQVIDLLSPHLDHMKSDGSYYDSSKIFLSHAEKSRIDDLCHKNTLLSKMEEEHIVKVCVSLGNFGYPVTVFCLRDIIGRTISKRLNIQQNVDVNHVCSRSYVKRFLRRHANLAKLVKAGCLDPVRANKITPEVRDTLFSKLDMYVKLLVSMKILPENVNGFSDLDMSSVYNADEVAIDTTKRARIKVLNENKPLEQVMPFRKTFEGDGKMAKHVTAMITSRMDGAYCYPGDDDVEFQDNGAVPPFIIHTQKSKKRKAASERSLLDVKNEEVGVSYLSGLVLPSSDVVDPKSNEDDINNPFGFGVRTTPNGSMQQDIFLDFAVHFIEHLPPDQGRDKSPVILLIDGHNSRWTVAALEHLRNNNVWIFVLPSHTSILTQPNDCGVNFKFHTVMAKVANQYCNSINGCTPIALNVIIRKTWEKFLNDEKSEFMETGENSATRAWRFCGYAPFNKYCESWNVHLEKVQQCNEILKELNLAKGKNVNIPKYEIEPRKIAFNTVFEVSNNSEKRNVFFSSYEEYSNELGSVCKVAYLRCTAILGRWVREGNFHKCPNTFAVKYADKMALMMMKFVRVDGYDMQSKVPSKDDVNSKMRYKMEMYLKNVKPIVDAVKASMVCDDGKKKDGIATKRRNGRWNIEFEDESKMTDLSIDQILDHDKIVIRFAQTNIVNSLKRISAMEEKVEEERATEIAKVRRHQELQGEYMKLCDIIKKGDVELFTYDDFINLGNKFTSRYHTQVNGRSVTLEPEYKVNNLKSFTPGCAVRQTVTDVLSSMEHHKEITTAMVNSERMKRKNVTVSKEFIENAKKKKIGSNFQEVTVSNVMEPHNLMDDFECNVKKDGNMKTTPPTQMGSNAISIEHHLRVANNFNKDNELKKKEKSLLISIKSKEKILHDINNMILKNSVQINNAITSTEQPQRKWFEWRLYKEGNKNDELDFKCLCRLMLPKAKLIGKSMLIKKQHFENEKVSELSILSTKEKMQSELDEEKCQLSELQSNVIVENDEESVDDEKVNVGEI